MDEKQQPGKKRYEPPKVTVISLRPEEAVLGHCKSASIGGPVGTACTNLGGCSVIGS